MENGVQQGKVLELKQKHTVIVKEQLMRYSTEILFDLKNSNLLSTYIYFCN